MRKGIHRPPQNHRGHVSYVSAQVTRVIRAFPVGKLGDIAEFRDDGGLPEHVRTVITVLPQRRVLEIRVEGLSVEADPDRTTIREVTNALFELASDYNIVALDAATPPLFTQRILLVDSDGRPFSAMMGTGLGDVGTVTPQRNQLPGV